MGLIIFISTVAIIAIIAYLLAYFVSREGGYPPYQDSFKCNHDCRQGRDCDCYQRSCDMSVQEYDKLHAAWPFPHNKP